MNEKQIRELSGLLLEIVESESDDVIASKETFRQEVQGILAQALALSQADQARLKDLSTSLNDLAREATTNRACTRAVREQEKA